MEIKKNDKFTVTIEDMGEDGAGIGRVDGYIWFVKDALIGDTIEASAMKMKKNYGFARLVRVITPAKGRVEAKCPVARACGGCQLQELDYKEQLKFKEKKVYNHLKRIGGMENLFLPEEAEQAAGVPDAVVMEPIIGMEDPYYYRNKVHAAFGRDRKGNVISGIYEEKSHRIVSVDDCMIEDKKSQEIIRTIRGMLKSFKIKTYDEDTGYGLLRHVLVRRGFSTGEIMVVLVTVSPIFPSKNNFVKALRKEHPEITTVVLNVNDRQTSMVLGDRNIVLYGPGFIKDRLMGLTFRISPSSFYQVNPVQTEVLYGKAMEFAAMTGKERVIDAYCGTGTIGIIASGNARDVIGVELNRDAIRDARMNARENKIRNVRFVPGDAGWFMEGMAAEGEKVEVVLMDPPRSGSDRKFLHSLLTLSPEKIVYVSCNPETLARDLACLTKRDYLVKKMQPVDMFPLTDSVEVVCLLENRRTRPGRA